MKNGYKIPNNKKIFHVKDLMNLGFTYYTINKIVLTGKLSRLTKSFYENNEFIGEDNDFYYVVAYAPKGIVCLLSAAVYYGLSNYMPDSIDVAIPNKGKLSTIPKWPNLNVYYFDEDRYNIGIKQVENQGNEFQIYDIEKTVVDIISYRNKVGIEETKEILRNYLAKSERNINQLIRYSERLNCNEVLKTYLEVLI
jgi:predicted transcriptional regulator of viral defense system